jgi:hypothetical protein
MQLSGTEFDRPGGSRRVRLATRPPKVKSAKREPTPTVGLRIAVSARGATTTIGLEGEWTLPESQRHRGQ